MTGDRALRQHPDPCGDGERLVARAQNLNVVDTAAGDPVGHREDLERPEEIQRLNTREGDDRDATRAALICGHAVIIAQRGFGSKDDMGTISAMSRPELDIARPAARI